MQELKKAHSMASLRLSYDRLAVEQKLNELEDIITNLISPLQEHVLNPPRILTDITRDKKLLKLNAMTGGLEKFEHPDFDLKYTRCI